VYATLLRDTDYMNLNQDACGRHGNYKRVAQTIPAAEVGRTLEAAIQDPGQVRHIACYIFEEKMNLRPDPDFDELAEHGIDSMAFAYGEAD
jgi:hypothetical protein